MVDRPTARDEARRGAATQTFYPAFPGFGTRLLLVALCFVAVPSLIALLTDDSMADGERLANLVFVVFWSVGSVGLLFFRCALPWIRTYEVEPEAITRRTRPFEPRRLEWKQLTGVEWRQGTIRLKGTDGRVLALPTKAIARADALAELLLVYLPPDLLRRGTVGASIENLACARHLVPAGAPEHAPSSDDRAERWRTNPFYVLDLRPEHTSADVERAGAKLLGMLALELASARTYRTPFGPAERTADKVRAAMAELRDPERRLLHEVWASVPAATEGEAPSDGGRATAPWPEAERALGWRTR